MTDSLFLSRFPLRRLVLAGLALACAGLMGPALRAADEHAQLDPATSETLSKVKDMADEADAMQKYSNDSAGNAGTTNLGALLKAKLDGKNNE